MARKTSAHALSLLQKYEDRMKNLEEILRIKSTVPEENQAPHVRDNSFDYYYGLIQGVVSMMDTILHEFNCYHGFYYVGPDRQLLEHVPGQSITENPEYRKWRVSYSIRA